MDPMNPTRLSLLCKALCKLVREHYRTAPVIFGSTYGGYDRAVAYNALQKAHFATLGEYNAAESMCRDLGFVHREGDFLHATDALLAVTLD